jgi:hypothetical protein
LSEQVTEAQMKALFGEVGTRTLMRSSRRLVLAAGQSVPGNEQANMFHRRSARAFRDYSTGHGLPADTPCSPNVRAQIRSDIAATMFVQPAAATRPMPASCTVRWPSPGPEH